MINQQTIDEVAGHTDAEIHAACHGIARLIEQDRTNEALQLAGYTLLLRPQQPTLYYLVGLCHQRAQRYGRAVSYYREALARGGDAAVLFALGEALLMLQQHQVAREALEQGLRVIGENSTRAHAKRARFLLSTYLQGDSA